ncbi:MAG: hypothetical protein ACK2UC_11140 [Anaerolineae bacterium]|jgi:peptidoglycan/LPS O-acetylase OafA/YrhL
MNEHQQTNSSPALGTQPGRYDRRSARRQRLQERRAARAGRFGAAWIGGVVLIAVGVLLLFETVTSISLERWWALIILIPAAGAFANGWRMYRITQELTVRARTSLIVGMLLAMVTAMLLLDLDWTVLAPVLIILAGLALLINVLLPG